MAQGEKKGFIARMLEGKERDENYARSTLPSNRWALFWDIFKGRLGKLVIVNLLMLIFFIPMIAVFVFRYMYTTVQGMMMPFASWVGVGYTPVPNLIGMPQQIVLSTNLLFGAFLLVASFIAAVGISGGIYVIRNMVWTEGIFVANDFLRGIRRNYWNVLEAVLFFTIFLFLARTMGNLADWLIAAGSPMAGWLIASKIVGYILMAFALLVAMWMISLGISYKQGPWALFRNAVVMTVGTFPQTLVFVACATWPIFLTMFGGSFFTVIGLLLLIFLAFSYALLVWLDFSQWAFDKFVNPNMGIATGRGLYNKDKAPRPAAAVVNNSASDSAAMREYRRMIVAQGKSKLVCRPIKPIDDELEVYQLPESFSRDDLQKLRESKQAIEDDTKAFEEEHKNDERYVEYNREFEEAQRALEDEDGKKKKKKKPTPPKMLNKR